MKYCTTCQQVWEYDAAIRKILIHSDFPSYGLPRDVCSDCKDPMPGDLFSKKVYIWQNLKRYHLDVGANCVVSQYPGRFEVMPLNVLPNIYIFWK